MQWEEGEKRTWGKAQVLFLYLNLPAKMLFDPCGDGLRGKAEEFLQVTRRGEATCRGAPPQKRIEASIPKVRPSDVLVPRL